MVRPPAVVDGADHVDRLSDCQRRPGKERVGLMQVAWFSCRPCFSLFFLFYLVGLMYSSMRYSVGYLFVSGSAGSHQSPGDPHRSACEGAMGEQFDCGKV